MKKSGFTEGNVLAEKLAAEWSKQQKQLNPRDRHAERTNYYRSERARGVYSNNLMRSSSPSARYRSERRRDGDRDEKHKKIKKHRSRSAERERRKHRSRSAERERRKHRSRSAERERRSPSADRERERRTAGRASPTYEPYRPTPDHETDQQLEGEGGSFVNVGRRQLFVPAGENPSHVVHNVIARSRSNTPPERSRDRRSRSRDRRGRSRDRSEESDRGNATMLWTHDKFARVASPGPEQRMHVPSDYRPPSPEWVSKAGGVAIMRKNRQQPSGGRDDSP